MTDWKRLNALLQWRSLKTRVTLATLAIFVAGIWSMSLYASRMLREDMQRLLGDQQFSTVSALASEVNHALDDRFKALDAVAANIDPAMLDHTSALQELLEQRPLLHDLFNGGIIACRPDGTAIADIPSTAGRIGINYMDVDTIAAALGEGKSTIGRPVMGKTLRAPIFAMTVPVRDPQGKVIAALSGAINLSKPSFLEKIGEGRYGKTGGFMLVARQHRLVVTATDKRLIMADLPAAGSNPLIDGFVHGREGSGVAINPLGVEVLGSAKSVPLANWYVAVALPTAEAFAPIHAMQQRVLLATILLTVLVGALTWWMLRRALSPMLATVDKLAAMGASDEPLRPLPSAGQSEIAQLIGGFNRLLESLAHRESTLRESEQRYRVFFEFSPDATFVHRDDIIIFANDAAARLFGAETAAALSGRNWHELILQDDWSVTERRIAALASGEASHMPPLERRHLTLDGEVVVMESTGARIIFDGQPAVLTVMRNITERKRVEEQRLADTRQQRDTLVREVHHRIKNNLQSVSGLLQRELGKYAELRPPLKTAISQVNAIAVVHGLQSDGSDEAIRLCESVRNICRTVADLSGRPVLFSIVGEHTTFRPVRVESSEAVSVALVLNELILNAVKHSPANGGDPTVALGADGCSARLLIRNGVKETPGFDLGSGRGLGTGLRLVRALLPKQGAELAHELDAEGFMLTSLSLTTPVVVAADPQEAGRP